MIVAIVGRPNVGKSTLFNRLIGAREAIVDEMSGVTRDRNYGTCTWNGVSFSIIDTGGYVDNSDDIFEEEINKQVRLAIEEASVIVFLVDVKYGLHELDKNVANILRRINKPVVLAVNKVDNNSLYNYTSDFYALGLGDFYPISAMTGSGTGDLLDRITELLPNVSENTEELNLPRFAIVGRPNAGKSTLTNVLLGEERNIVTPIAGTTRDSIYTRYNKYNHDFLLVDTAGIRKKGKVSEDIEFYSVMRAIRTIENSDVCILLIDASRGFESQDMNIMSLIMRNSKGLVVVVNKWDLVDKTLNNTVKYEKALKERTAPFTDYPVLFVSALNKLRIHKILETAEQVHQNRTRRVSTSELNNVMLDIIQKTPPPATKGKYIKIKYVTQLPSYSPAFAFFCNLPQYIKEPYKRFIENRLRENFDFAGVPIKIFFRKK